jgi:hypothetical protein
MARPRELYNTPAPQAMSMMGAGIADAYARAGEIEGKGMMAMGQGIAQGLTAMGQAYGDYKKMQSQVKADSAAFNSFKDYLPAEFVNKQQALENDPKASLLDKQQFYQSAKGYLGAAIGQKNKMDQIEAEQEGLFKRTVAGKKTVPDLTNLSSGLTQAVSDQQPSQTAPKTTSPMPGSELDFERAISTLESHMVKKYGPDYKQRKIQATQQDIMEAGL